MANYPVTHFEVTAKEPKKLHDFYTGVFGWKLTDAPNDYKMVDTASGSGIGGGIAPSRDGRGGLTVYIETKDLKGTLEKVERSGGRTLMPPMKAGPIEIAMFADPEGNVFGLATPM